MNLAFDWEIFYYQKYGGISRYVCRLAEALAELGNNSRVFAPLYTNRYLSEIEKVDVVGRFTGVLNQISPRVCRAVNVSCSNKAIRNWQPDVLHKTYYHPINRDGIDCPIVVTVHDMIHELYPEDFPTEDLTAEFKAAAVAEADHVICISEKTRQDVISILNIHSEKTNVVYHGVDTFFSLSSSIRVNKLYSSPYILFVGDRRGYKNFDLVLKAFSISSRLKSDFHIVVFGGGALTNEEMSRANSLGVNPERIVHFAGGDKVLRSLYCGAEALVYPSKYEGFGFPPLEAMGCGCPVVCTSGGSVPEIVGCSGSFFDPYSAEDLVHALEKVAYSEYIKQKLMSRGHDRFSQFSWASCAKKTQEVYEAL